MLEDTAVVMVHYRDQAATFACLDSLRSREKKVNFKIYVVNNGHEDLSSAQSHFPKIKILASGKNLGFAQGSNLGIKEALKEGGKNIILLNGDTLAGSNLIFRLVDFSLKNKEAGLVSPKIYFAPGFEYHRQKYTEKEEGKVIWYAGGLLDWRNVYASHRGVDEVDKGQYNQVCQTDFATGCCMLITPQAIRKTGILDSRYFLYYEDVDYSIRVQKSGLKTFYCPQAFLWHKNALSSEGVGSEIHLYYQTRNRLYLGFKYASARARKSLILESLYMLRERSVRRRAVIDYYLRRMHQGSL